MASTKNRQWTRSGYSRPAKWPNAQLRGHWAWTGTALGDKAARLSAAFGIPATADLATALDRFNREIGLPASLSKLGIGHDALRAAAERAGSTPYHRLAPRNGSADEYLAVLEAAGSNVQ